jgi:hypothetical protein
MAMKDGPVNHPRNTVRVSRVTRGDEVLFAEDEQALEAFRADAERERAREARRGDLWGRSSLASMTRLCHAFPSLRGAAGVDPWDAVELLRWACSGKSHGEVLAARFVLGVWNTGADWNEIAHEEGILSGEARFARFDFFGAFGTWDQDHREAFLLWARDPFWP